jgi:hypothetical protein
MALLLLPSYDHTMMIKGHLCAVLNANFCREGAPSTECAEEWGLTSANGRKATFKGIGCGLKEGVNLNDCCNLFHFAGKALPLRKALLQECSLPMESRGNPISHPGSFASCAS